MLGYRQASLLAAKQCRRFLVSTPPCGRSAAFYFVSSLFSSTTTTNQDEKRRTTTPAAAAAAAAAAAKRTTNNGAVNVLIVGGGPVGSSTAYHLAREQRGGDGTGIVVVEQDMTYKSASAMASVGGIRQQFSLKENVQMSLYGHVFITQASERLATAAATTTTPAGNHDQDDDGVVHHRHRPDLQFVPGGYLFLAQSSLGVERLRENHATQLEAGCRPDDMQLHAPTQLQALFPWLNVDDVLLGSHGSRTEGWFDPWAYLCALRDKNKSMGVRYVQARPVAATRRTAAGAIESLRLLHIDTGETESVSVDLVVNAAGAYSGALLDLLAGGGPAGPNGVVQTLPVKPRKRCVFFFQCDMKQPDAQPVPTLAPLTVDATGVYFRSEGQPGRGTFVGGVSPSPDNDQDCWDPVTDLSVDHYLWGDIVWPTLFHRVPAFGAVKVVSSWAGLYDYNALDQNAIIDFHPDIPNLLLVTGFSGHGLQHSPAAGRAAAELLSHGRFQSCDLSIFSFQRCIDNRPVFEQGIV